MRVQPTLKILFSATWAAKAWNTVLGGVAESNLLFYPFY